MAKIKAPLFSLGAHGSVADDITLQDSFAGTIMRPKPRPKDTKTLKQIYQRWLYQDCAAWWHEQSPAQQQVYETAARRHHMTGFAWWMKEKLLFKFGLVFGAHLDERSGNIATDFSANANHGTIHGCTHLPGIIDYALSFNGVDNWVDCGNDAAFNITKAITICSHIYFTGQSAWHGTVLSKSYQSYELLHKWNTGYFSIATAGGISSGQFTYPAFQLGKKFHVGVTYDGTNYKAYVDGNEIAIVWDAGPFTGDIAISANAVMLGRRPGSGNWMDGWLDETLLMGTAVSGGQMKRLSERKYPE